MAPTDRWPPRGTMLPGALLLLCGLCLLLCSACSSSDAASCSPGLVRSCPCVGGQQGVQSCNADGKSWGPCSGCAGQADGGRDGLAGDGKVSDQTPPPSDAGVPGTWIAIKAGAFTMGSAASSLCHDTTETEHKVTLTHGFEIATTEVTQAQFKAVVGYNPSGHVTCGASCPVEKVNWYEAAAYCNALSSRQGLSQCYTCSGVGSHVTCKLSPAYGTPAKSLYHCPGYRLPSDAEWEYAYRAGTQTDLHNGLLGSCDGSDTNADAIGWYDKNSGKALHPVGKKKANPWGLFDMAGNIREWCHDGFSMDLGSAAVTDPLGPESSSARVWRSGSYVGIVRGLRAAFRTLSTPEFRCVYQGFRCVRSTN